MKINFLFAFEIPRLFVLAALTSSTVLFGQDSTPAPITAVEIRDRVFYVNGQPFFPLMSWLQAPTNFTLVKQSGMNTTAGYWSGSGGTANVSQYMEAAAKAGLYGVMPFNAQLQGNPFVLGYIHGDEPDLPRQVSDAKVEPSPALRLNPRNPLWKLVDGDLSSWSVLDPLENAWLTIHLPQPATVESLGLALTVAKGLALPKEVVFIADGQELLKTNAAAKSGLQKFALPQPVTIKDLTLKITAVTPGDQVWGSLGEIAGFDREGKNVLLNPPRKEPRAWPAKTLEEYKTIKAADPSRPVFMTLTGNFLPFFKQWTASQYALYPEYIKATDVVGYDIYPIYGWNKPEWIHLGHEATELLVQMAGPRPVYAWIETSKGGQWTGPLENQKDVTGEHIRAEVWMCICRGATAIGYFTHVWKPAYAQFGVPEANRQALRQINDQIAKLTPAILGKPHRNPVSIESANHAKLDLLARESNGELFLFAVNYDEQRKTAQAKIQVIGLAPGTPITVVDEARQVSAVAGGFSDTFAPLAVHIYKISLQHPPLNGASSQIDKGGLHSNPISNSSHTPAQVTLQEGTSFNLGNQKAHLKKLDTLHYVDSEYSRRFRFDSSTNPKLRQLREQYQLEAVVAPGQDEFDQQMLLMDWTHQQFTKFGRPSVDARGALEILPAIQQGHAFFCTQYAIVFVSCAASLGWIDRPLALRRHQDTANATSSEHTTTEIWSNLFRKWIMLDPTSNLYLEKDGVPLNAYEIRQEWFYHQGQDLVFVVGKQRKKYRKADLPIFLRHFPGFGDLAVHPDELDKYGFIAYIPNNDLMDAGFEYGKMFIVKDKLCEGTRWHVRTVPTNPAVDPYFPLGQANLNLRVHQAEIRVDLQTLTPNFKQFEIQVDGTGWKPSTKSSAWTVHPGRNRIEARSVNQFEVRGPIAIAELEITRP